MNAAFPIREGSVGQTPCSRRDNRIACMSQLVLHDGYMARAEAASDLTDRAGEGMRSMWSAKADRARGRKLGLGQFNMGRKRVADKLAMKHARGYGAHTNNEGEGRGDRGEGESESDSEGDVDSDVERLERCGDAPLLPPPGFSYVETAPQLATEGARKALVGRAVLVARIDPNATGWFPAHIQSAHVSAYDLKHNNPKANFVVEFRRAQTGTADLVGKAPMELTAGKYGAQEWWLLLQSSGGGRS